MMMIIVGINEDGVIMPNFPEKCNFHVLQIQVSARIWPLQCIVLAAKAKKQIQQNKKSHIYMRFVQFFSKYLNIS